MSRLLRPLDGDADDAVDGAAVLRKIGAVLARDLPLVPLSDPYRADLEKLAHACAADPRPRPRPGPRAAP